MQGYDTGQLLAAGMKAVGGDVKKRDALIKAMQTAKIDSPRGRSRCRRRTTRCRTTTCARS
jgi:hypothetical protein